MINISDPDMCVIFHHQETVWVPGLGIGYANGFDYLFLGNMLRWSSSGRIDLDNA